MNRSDDVILIRLPDEIIHVLDYTPENGMGYHTVGLVLEGGDRRIGHVVNGDHLVWPKDEPFPGIVQLITQ